MRRFRHSTAVPILYWLFVCLCIAVCVVVLRQHLPRYLPYDWANANDGDALTDWRAARLYPLEISPYKPIGLDMILAAIGHPPSTVFWYLPMANFSKALVAELTSLMLWFLIVPHIYMCAKALEWPAPMAVTALLTSLVFSTIWFHYHFSVIQLSELIAFLMLLGWLFLRSGRDTLAGICIGLAATIKFFPGIMILVLFASGRWRAFLWASATFLVIAGIMTSAFGIESWSEFLALQKPVTELWYGSLQSSSLSGLINQIRSSFCGGGVAAAHSSTPKLAAAGAAILLGLVYWQSRSHLKRARYESGSSIDLPFALFTLVSVFINPWVWEHYYVLVIQPLFVVTTEFVRLARLAYRRWSDTETSNFAFALQVIGFASALLGICLVIFALSRHIWNPWWYVDAWDTTKDPFYHWVVHVELVLKLVPWVVPIVLCFAALRARRKFTLAG